MRSTLLLTRSPGPPGRHHRAVASLHAFGGPLSGCVAGSYGGAVVVWHVGSASQLQHPSQPKVRVRVWVGGCVCLYLGQWVRLCVRSGRWVRMCVRLGRWLRVCVRYGWWVRVCARLGQWVRVCLCLGRWEHARVFGCVGLVGAMGCSGCEQISSSALSLVSGEGSLSEGRSVKQGLARAPARPPAAAARRPAAHPARPPPPRLPPCRSGGVEGAQRAGDDAASQHSWLAPV